MSQRREVKKGRARNTMIKPYRLYWVKDKGCDFGTPVGLEDLDASIRDRVAALTSPKESGIELRLPYLDSRELRGRSQALQTLKFLRGQDGIVGTVPSSLGPFRDKAAWLVASHSAWRQSPRETDPEYARVWQRVSIGLQKKLRGAISERYFADSSRYADRDVAYSVIVYSVCRPCPGRSRTEFVYDVADEEMLSNALRAIGSSTRKALAFAEARLLDCGNASLAHRYSPVWYEDIIRAVKKKPARLISLLGDEGMLINAIIQLGIFDRNAMIPDLRGVKPFARVASLAMRSIFGVDMRPLVMEALDEATILLQQGAHLREARSTISRSQRARPHPPSLEPDTSGHCMPGSAAYL